MAVNIKDFNQCNSDLENLISKYHNMVSEKKINPKFLFPYGPSLDELPIDENENFLIALEKESIVGIATYKEMNNIGYSKPNPKKRFIEITCIESFKKGIGTSLIENLKSKKSDGLFGYCDKEVTGFFEKNNFIATKDIPTDHLYMVVYNAH